MSAGKHSTIEGISLSAIHTLGLGGARLRRLIIFGAIAAVLLVGVQRWWAWRSTQVVQQISQDRGYFYRFTAKFEVKGTGERLDFDYVVACNIRLTRWRDGGSSNDGTFSPRVMFKATTGGHAVMLKTLDECSGMTSANDDIPTDILPVAVWFDSVDDVSTGIGYMSEDAYASPLRKLTFLGARIDVSTRADWDAWRKQSAESYAQIGAMPGPWGYDYPDNLNADNPDAEKYVAGCYGYTGLQLPEPIRAKIRPLWPAERRFWSPPNEDDLKIQALLEDQTTPEPRGDPRWIRKFGRPSSGDGVGSNGVPLKSGRQVQPKPHVSVRWPTEIYPFLWPPLTSINPVTKSSYGGDVYVQKLEFRSGKLNGFAACQSRTELTAAGMQAADPAWATKRHVFAVSDDIIRERGKDSLFSLRPGYVFERDEYVFVIFGLLF